MRTVTVKAEADSTGSRKSSEYAARREAWAQNAAGDPASYDVHYYMETFGYSAYIICFQANPLKINKIFIMRGLICIAYYYFRFAAATKG